MSQPVSERRFKDAALTRTVTLPNAAETKTTASVDLQAANPHPVTERIALKVTTTAATGVTDKLIVVSLQDSADNSSFAPIAGTGTLTLEAAANAYPAGSLSVSLPAGTRRYIRAAALGESGGGNASNGTLTLELNF